MEHVENPFIGKALSLKFTEPMTEEQSKNFISVTMIKEEDLDIKEVMDSAFVLKVIQKRIDVLELGISFSAKAAMYIAIFAGQNPGKAVIILIDLLTKFGERKIRSGDVVDLYPNGFYNSETFMDYIDNYLKPKTVKWSEMY